jgi:hypothetical protein
MSSSRRPEPSQRLLDLIFMALEHGVRSIQGTDGPLIPFLLSEDQTGKRSLARYMTGANPSEAREHALRAVTGLPADTCLFAVAADGQVTIG